MAVCAACRGTGNEFNYDGTLNSHETCRICRGKKVLPKEYEDMLLCGSCRGTGFSPDRGWCKTCNNKGLITRGKRSRMVISFILILILALIFVLWLLLTHGQPLWQFISSPH
jgi:DnaJ-class molecular chaperone